MSSTARKPRSWLTNLITKSVSPFCSLASMVIGGQERTFLLKQDGKGILGNTSNLGLFTSTHWEDDFYDDPLTAILGQLSRILQEIGTLKSLAGKVAEAAVPLIKQNIQGALQKHTGLTLALDQSN